MADNFDTDNRDFLMGRDRMNKEDWLKQNAMEVAILDKVIAYLKQLRDATAIQSYPGGLKDFGIRKKQAYDHWVAGESAGSSEKKTDNFWGEGLEDCGK